MSSVKASILVSMLGSESPPCALPGSLQEESISSNPIYCRTCRAAMSVPQFASHVKEGQHPAPTSAKGLPAFVNLYTLFFRPPGLPKIKLSSHTTLVLRFLYNSSVVNILLKTAKHQVKTSFKS